MKVVTFVIPAYNSKSYIRKCLDSFLTKEDKPNYEVLVVSDGSQDETYEICAQYAQKYQDTFRAVQKENGGHGSVINAAVPMITTKYFKVVDADDWVDTKNLAKYCEELAHTDADVVLTNYQMIDAVSNEITNWKTYLDDYDKEYTLSELNDQWKNICRCFTFHGLTYRTEFYRQYGMRLLEHVYYEDQEFAAVPLCYSKRIKAFNLNIYQYRVGDSGQSVSLESRLRQMHHTDQVLHHMLQYAADHTQCLDAAGRLCLERKIAGFALSHFTMLWLGARDKKEARRLADELKNQYTNIYQMLKKKYLILQTLSFFRFRYEQWEKLYESGFYNFIRGNYQYD